MGVLEAVVQGVVQGLTEFLPVSSSGHLLLSQHVLGVHENNLFFNIMLHMGTLIAVLAVYYKKIIELIKSCFSIIKKIFTLKFDIKKTSDNEQLVISLIIGLIPLFLLFVPVPTTGMTVKEIAESMSNEKNIIIVGICLIFTSFLLRKGQKVQYSETFSRIKYDEKNHSEICHGRSKVLFLDALWIGIMQFVAAIFPGISRSGSTLSVGLVRGVSRQSALDYSFIIGIPTILAAGLLETKEAIEQNLLQNIDITPMIIGVLVSAIVGFLAIKIFKWLLKTNKMMIFVVYTFVLGLISVITGILELCSGRNIFTGFSI